MPLTPRLKAHIDRIVRAAQEQGSTVGVKSTSETTAALELAHPERNKTKKKAVERRTQRPIP